MEQQSDIFTIEESVNFHPKENLLKNITNGKSMLLNWPTSCCLLLLIQHQGETIPAATFMQQVWGSKNIIISKNTLIKNISLLRSALAYLGLPKAMVSTINGEGYRIPLSYSITHITLAPSTIKEHELKTAKAVKLTKNLAFFTKNALVIQRWAVIFLVCLFILFYSYKQ